MAIKVYKNFYVAPCECRITVIPWVSNPIMRVRFPSFALQLCRGGGMADAVGLSPIEVSSCEFESRSRYLLCPLSLVVEQRICNPLSNVRFVQWALCLLEHKLLS